MDEQKSLRHPWPGALLLSTEGTLNTQVTEDFSHATHLWRELHKVDSEKFMRCYSVPPPRDAVWWDEGWHRIVIGLLLEEISQ